MRDEIRRENNDLRERLIDVQTRSIDGIGEDENEKKHPIIFTQKEYYSKTCVNRPPLGPRFTAGIDSGPV
jgi:hypothetical protein